jgi:hypothetical protein
MDLAFVAILEEHTNSLRATSRDARRPEEPRLAAVAPPTMAPEPAAIIDLDNERRVDDDSNARSQSVGVSHDHRRGNRHDAVVRSSVVNQRFGDKVGVAP